MRASSISAVVGVCIALSGCAPTARVMIEKLDPPDADVSGISEIAVLPFSGTVTGSARGQAVAQRLAEVVANTGRYRVMKDDQMKSLLDRAGIQFSYPPDAPTVRRMGTALGVDAFLYGELEKFQCEEESRARKSELIRYGRAIT